MTDEKKINISGIGKGIAFSLILTFLLILAIAAVCYFFVVSDRLLSMLVLGAAGISVLVGALLAARSSQGAGLLHGGILGFGYGMVLIVSNIISKGGFSFDTELLTILVSVIASGMLGGILGINSKND